MGTSLVLVWRGPALTGGKGLRVTKNLKRHVKCRRESDFSVLFLSYYADSRIERDALINARDRALLNLDSQ